MTAVDGGGRTTDAIHTNATAPGTGELFTVVDAGGGYVGIQTFTGNYVTAVGGGGQTTDAIHTNATARQDWEKFKLVPIDGQQDVFGIQTVNGHYLTAVGGGGQTADAIHTNATVAQGWEQFHFVCDWGQEPDGSVTLTPLPGATGVTTIRCTGVAGTPQLASFNKRNFVRAVSTASCPIPMMSIVMTGTISLNNNLAATQTDINPLSVKTEPAALCFPGIWTRYTVAEIKPPPGIRASIGDTVDLAPTQVDPHDCLPTLFNMLDPDARVYIAQLGYTVGTVTHQPSDQPIDSVISESLEANGTSVDLVESNGNAVVPNVLGQEEADAVTAIEGSGLVADVVHKEDCISTGDVETQHPTGGARAFQGDPVTITVSTCNNGGGSSGGSGGSGGTSGGGSGGSGGQASGSSGGPIITP